MAVDVKQQKLDMSKLLSSSLVKGATWFLIDCRWMKQWKLFVGYDEDEEVDMVGDASANPGPIDNSNLLEKDMKTLKENLNCDVDYTLVSEPAWDKFVEWYSIEEGQEPLARRVIEQGMFTKSLSVEVYRMKLQFSRYSDKNTISGEFSRVDPLEVIEAEMRQELSLPADKFNTRLWRLNSHKYERFTDLKVTLQDSGLYTNQHVVVEVQNSDGSWPLSKNEEENGSAYLNSNCANSGASGSSVDPGQVTSTSASKSSSIFGASASGASHGASSSSSYSTSNYFSSYDYRSTDGPGLCGLSNLGNTCFMNSAIQCMSNVPSLTEYMLNDSWKDELNRDNPLGMNGEIATSYADLIKTMWSGKFTYTTPRMFKIAVGRFKPEFSGYQQQDSQELMAFLLDGLHEDLNRIKKKPYIETKEANNRPDEEVARESWADYIKRNNSVIVDTFHGLLKSTLVCPECNRVSVKFDPFCYLSLPLPVKRERQIEVILVPLDSHLPLCQYKVTVPKMGCVLHICNALSLLTKIPSEKMLVVDVYNHRFHKVYTSDESLTCILDRDDIFVYEIPVNVRDSPDTLLIPVYLREDRPMNKSHSLSHTYTPTTKCLFGTPVLVAVPRTNCTYGTLYNCVLNSMTRFVRVSEIRDSWWTSSHKRSSEEKINKEDDVEEMNNDGDSDTSPDNHNSNSESESPDKEDDDISDMDPDQQTQRLFTFIGVNSSGTSEVDSIRDDGQPIRFSHHPYLVAHWNPKAKSLFFDEKAAETLIQHESVHGKVIQRKQEILLSDCLELFTTREKLGENDPWFCPTCKKHQQASKKFDIWRLPKTLVIHLKRFSYTRYYRDKLDSFVRYPTRSLDMQKWIINPDHGRAVYDLISVSNHYGGMGGGHYTAYAKNNLNGHWYHFDDSSVTLSAEESVVTQAGYVLVYQLSTAKVSSSVDRPLRSTSTEKVYNHTSTARGEKPKNSDSSDEEGDSTMDVN